MTQVQITFGEASQCIDLLEEIVGACREGQDDDVSEAAAESHILIRMVQSELLKLMQETSGKEGEAASGEWHRSTPPTSDDLLAAYHVLRRLEPGIGACAENVTQALAVAHVSTMLLLLVKQTIAGSAFADAARETYEGGIPLT